MRRTLPIAAGLLAALLVASQLLLPGCAERSVRGDLEDRGGTVDQVSISAFPALKLLGGRADDVEVRLSEFKSSAGGLADRLAETEAADSLDASTAELRTGPLTLREARLRKEGDVLHGEAQVTEADLAAALPAGLDVRPVSAQDGAIIFEGTAGLLGIEARIRLRAAVEDGAIVVRPEGIPFAGLVGFTVFKDPRIRVDRLDARATPDGFAVSADGRLVR